MCGCPLWLRQAAAFGDFCLSFTASSLGMSDAVDNLPRRFRACLPAHARWRSPSRALLNLRFDIGFPLDEQPAVEVWPKSARPTVGYRSSYRPRQHPPYA